MRRAIVSSLGMFILMVVVSGAPLAAVDVDRIVSFDASAGEFPEGVAVDKDGTIYVSLARLPGSQNIAFPNALAF